MYDFDTVIDRRGTGACKWEFAPEAVQQANMLPLSIADMEFKMPPQVQSALHGAVDHGVCGYTTVDDEYFSAVAGFMKRRHGFVVQRDWLCVTPGVVTALGIAVRAYTEPGDGVIIQPPVYMPFWSAISGNKRELLENQLIYENGRYTVDFDNLEELCRRPEAKLMIISSPHNPVCRVWQRWELERMGRICKENGVIILADEIHQDIVMPGYTHTVISKIDGMEDNCIICTAMSKTFNLAGLSCSNIFIPNRELREKFVRVQQRDSTTGVPFYARYAAIAAYTECDSWVDELIRYIDGTFKFMYKFIDERLPGIHCLRAEGTYLAWVDMRALGLTDSELETLAVEKGLLALDEGYIFGTGGSGFERWNIAVPRSALEAALIRLEKAIKGI